MASQGFASGRYKKEAVAVRQPPESQDSGKGRGPGRLPYLPDFFARSSALRMETLSIEIGLCASMLELARTRRDLGYVESGVRSLHLALRACLNAQRLLSEATGIDPIWRSQFESQLEEFNRLLAGFPLPKSVQPESAPASRNSGPKLTGRERQVVKLVAEGHSTRQIAVLLGISFKTAACHRYRSMEKLGAPNVAALVRYAMTGGLSTED